MAPPATPPRMRRLRSGEASRALNFAFDPSNGTVSAGDVLRVKQGGPEAKPALPAVDALGLNGAPVQAPPQKAVAEAAGRPAATPSASAASPALGNALEAVVGDEASKDKVTALGGKNVRFYVQDGQLADRESGVSGVAPARREGLLSLGIEMPEGGVQRRLDGLGGDLRG